MQLTKLQLTVGEAVGQKRPGPKFTDIVLRFILRCVIRSSYDKSYDVLTLSYHISQDKSVNFEPSCL